MNFADLTESKLYEIDPKQLEEFMHDSFYIEIPVAIESDDDLAEAQRLLAQCGAYYSYLAYTTLQIRTRKKMMQLEKADKDAISRVRIYEDIFTTFTEITKHAFSTISRMISTKDMNDRANVRSGMYTP